ncbi:MAG: glycosyltransferase family 4 protein [Pseudomonadota bacterium]
MSTGRRIILLAHGFQPEYEAGYANGLARNGWTVTLIGSDMSLADRLHAGVRLLNLRGSQSPARPRWRKVANLLRYWLQCYGHVLRHRGSPVHMIGNFSTGNLRISWLEARLTRLLAGRYAMTVHNLLPHDDHNARSFRLSRAIYRTAAICMVHTPRMRAALAEDFGIDPERIVVAEHGIDRLLPATPASRAAMRARLKLDESDRLILFFGNLSPYKGADVLIDAFDRIEPTLNARLLIAGRCRSGDLRNALRSRIATSPRRERIEWMEGYIAEADVAPLFHAADVLAMPYRHIDQSGVVFMALATGLRVVASDVGSLRDYIPDGFGRMVPPGDEAALARGIEAVLGDARSAADPTVFASRYLWSETVKPMLAAYPRLAGG